MTQHQNTTQPFARCPICSALLEWGAAYCGKCGNLVCPDMLDDTLVNTMSGFRSGSVTPVITQEVPYYNLPPEPDRKKGIKPAHIAVSILLALVIILGGILLHLVTSNSGSGVSQDNLTPSTNNNDSTPVLVPTPPPTAKPALSPTSVPTDTPTSLPTPLPQPGTELFVSNFNDISNPQGWSLGGWHIGYGKLDCTDCSDLRVPYFPSMSDYALEVTMQAHGGVGLCIVCPDPSFKVCIHVEDNQPGYCGGVGLNGAFIDTNDGQQYSTAYNQNGRNNTYKIEFHQGEVRFFINNALMFKPIIANSSPDAGYAFIRLTTIQNATITQVRIIAA
jgi:hypothetical protein